MPFTPGSSREVLLSHLPPSAVGGSTLFQMQQQECQRDQLACGAGTVCISYRMPRPSILSRGKASSMLPNTLRGNQTEKMGSETANFQGPISKSLAPKLHLASGSTTLAAKTNKNPTSLNLIVNKLSVISPFPLIHPKLNILPHHP